MKRGILTVADLRERSRIGPTGCWHFLGAKSTDGTPRIWTLDYGRCEKLTMSGPAAVWNISRGERVPEGMKAFRRCVTTDCVNPTHIAVAYGNKGIGWHIARTGKRKGTHVEQRRANVAKAWAAAGIAPTPGPIVLAIRAAGAEVTNVELARRFGLAQSAVSGIRLGKTRNDVGAAA